MRVSQMSFLKSVRSGFIYIYGFCEVNMTQAEVTILRPPFRVFPFVNYEQDNRLVRDDLLKAFGYE